ncbi:MAG: RNA polymerase sigma factor SigX [Bacillus sp. (in: firmicutes)]
MDSEFQQLYEKYHQDLFQFLFYMVKNRETAEDLIQEVYIKVFNNYQKFEGKSSEKTWLYSIARNTAIDYFRKQRNWKQRLFSNFDWGRETIKDETPLPEEIAILHDDVKTLYKCLDCCNIDQKSVLILRYVQSLSIAETAEILNWTDSKVKTTQHRALKVLKEIFESEGSNGRRKNEQIDAGQR